MHGQVIFQIELLYGEYLEQFGLQLVVLPHLPDIEVINQLHPALILLPGGGDIPSAYYDSNVNVLSQQHRDLIEMELIQFAINNNTPLLGICRGMQMINGFFGGKVTRTSGCSHPVSVEHTILVPDFKSIYVNSFHRDVIQIGSLADSFEVIALHENHKHVEAFMGVKQPILGLQWHPERENKNSLCKMYSDKLIAELIEKGERI